MYSLPLYNMSLANNAIDIPLNCPCARTIARKSVRLCLRQKSPGQILSIVKQATEQCKDYPITLQNVLYFMFAELDNTKYLPSKSYMTQFLRTFEKVALMATGSDIDASDLYYSLLSRVFSPEYTSGWDHDNGFSTFFLTPFAEQWLKNSQYRFHIMHSNHMSNIASTIWPASYALVDVILLLTNRFRNLFSGKEILELGSGTGLAGFAIASLWPHITDRLPNSFALSEMNISICDQLRASRALILGSTNDDHAECRDEQTRRLGDTSVPFHIGVVLFDWRRLLDLSNPDHCPSNLGNEDHETVLLEGMEATSPDTWMAILTSRPESGNDETMSQVYSITNDPRINRQFLDTSVLIGSDLVYDPSILPELTAVLRSFLTPSKPLDDRTFERQNTFSKASCGATGGAVPPVTFQSLNNTHLKADMYQQEAKFHTCSSCVMPLRTHQLMDTESGKAFLSWLNAKSYSSASPYPSMKFCVLVSTPRTVETFDKLCQFLTKSSLIFVEITATINALLSEEVEKYSVDAQNMSSVLSLGSLLLDTSTTTNSLHELLKLHPDIPCASQVSTNREASLTKEVESSCPLQPKVGIIIHESNWNLYNHRLTKERRMID